MGRIEIFRILFIHFGSIKDNIIYLLFIIIYYYLSPCLVLWQGYQFIPGAPGPNHTFGALVV